ncbi:uncharacterized protein RCO7_11042 [Rhynchosporium graminicola]|uniref:Uncharacterized protein n=1 Tax=Rhynchosporium graminicola TaxID=2792576 RepID=A0A1E1KVR3_9HELO|nr:uncharacterized protein RCO7_11042 [Rhynchosporium commune]
MVATAPGAQFRTISPETPNVKLLKNSVNQTLDPKEAVLTENGKTDRSGTKVARCYGKSVNAKAIRNFYDRTIKHDIRAILNTLENGGDPEELQLCGIAKISGGNVDDPPAETAKCFGDGLKANALNMHFVRNIKPTSNLILEAIARGEDPFKTVPVGAELKGSGAKEMVKYFGDDATPGSLQVAICRNVTPVFKLVKDHADAGGNCKDLDLFGNAKSEKDIAKHFDTSLNRDAIRMAIARHVTPNVKLVLDCITAGGNPMDLNIGSSEVKDASKDYTRELAKHFGSDTTQGGIAKMFSRHIIPPSKLVRDCVKSGGDPKDLTLWGDIKNDAGKGGQKGQEFTHQHLNFLHIFSLLILVFLFDCLRSLSFRSRLGFGSDATAGGIRFQYFDRIKKDIDALRKGRADGVDCKEITLQSLGGPAVKGPSSVLHFTPTAQFFYTTWQFLIIPLEIAAVMGSDVTPNGIRFQFTDRIKPTAKIQQDIRSAGLDPKDIDLDSIYSIKKGDISKYFGKDSTKGGIEFQFRTIKQDAKRQKACADTGGDPQTLGIGTGAIKASGPAIAHYMADGATAAAVEHRFRPLKKEAETLKCAKPTCLDCLRMSDGTTATALQHRFRPIKKEADAINAAIAGNFGDGDNSVKKTPAKRTPKKKPSTKATDGDDDEGSMIETPSKSTLKKVKGGRIGKATSSRGRAKNYTEPDEEDDDEVEMQGTTNLKEEDDEDIDISSPGFGNGNGHNSNGHGHAYIKSDHGDHDGYDGEELYFEAINDDDEA